MTERPGSTAVHKTFRYEYKYRYSWRAMLWKTRADCRSLVLVPVLALCGRLATIRDVSLLT